MIGYIARRLIIAFFMLIGVGLVSFIVIKASPGDYASRFEAYLLAQGMPQADAERLAQTVRVQYGLDKPATQQFLVWIEGILTKGQFGFSFAYREDVGALIAERAPRTLLLALLCHLTSSILGIGLGIFVAPRKYGFWDNLSAVVAFLLTSIPRFSLTVILLYFLVVDFHWTSVIAWVSPQYVFAPWSLAKILDMFAHIWPVIAIAGLGGVARESPRDPRQPAGCIRLTVRYHSSLKRANGISSHAQACRAQCSPSNSGLSRDRASLYDAR